MPRAGGRYSRSRNGYFHTSVKRVLPLRYNISNRAIQRESVLETILSTDGAGAFGMTYDFRYSLVTNPTAHTQFKALYRRMRVVKLAIQYVPNIPFPSSVYDNSWVFAYDPDYNAVPTSRVTLMSLPAHRVGTMSKPFTLTVVPAYETGVKGLHSTEDADVPKFGYMKAISSAGPPSKFMGRMYIRWTILYDVPVAPNPAAAIYLNGIQEGIEDEENEKQCDKCHEMSERSPHVDFSGEVVDIDVPDAPDTLTPVARQLESPPKRARSMLQAAIQELIDPPTGERTDLQKVLERLKQVMLEI